MADERAALSLAFFNFVEQRETRTKLLMPATKLTERTELANELMGRRESELPQAIVTDSLQITLSDRF